MDIFSEEGAEILQKWSAKKRNSKKQERRLNFCLSSFFLFLSLLGCSKSDFFGLNCCTICCNISSSFFFFFKKKTIFGAVSGGFFTPLRPFFFSLTFSFFCFLFSILNFDFFLFCFFSFFLNFPNFWFFSRLFRFVA